MASRQDELLPILKALREYIVKEYAVNYPPHVRGEDASAKDLPADWQDKLDPITGGDTVGRDNFGSQGQNSTKAGSQSEDAYIHKADLEAVIKEAIEKHFVDGQNVQTSGDRGANAGYSYPGEAGRIPEGLEKNEHMDEEEGAPEMNGDAALPEMEDMEGLGEEDQNGLNGEEEEENEMNGIAAGGGHMAYSQDGNVAGLLKDIKGLLSQKQAEKQEVASIKGEISDIKKSLDSSIKKGIQAGLQRHNIKPSTGDLPQRNAVSANPSPIPTATPDARIGVEGANFAKTEQEMDWDKQDQFTNGVEQILNANDPDDLRGTFKKVNGMRNQSGELTPQTLYYYPRNGGAQ